MRVCLCVNYNMAGYICIIAALCLCVAVSGAPPSAPRLYAQHAPAHLQNINPLDYFTENSEVANYYNQAQQKQGSGPQSAPARLESLEPDSEVELIPGAQQPQQPPQQTPVSPHLPGIAPGQRVFIVQMPIPGYRPGTIGGYQPVYIVAAAPQGNPGYPANGYQNGYQNAILLNPSGQAVISPYFGYQGVAPQPAGLVGALPFNRPFEQVYQQDPAAFAYQPLPGSPGVNGRPLHLPQLVNLQGQQAHPANSQRTATNEALMSPDPKRVGEASDSEETKEAQEPRRARPTSAHSQSRNKV